MKLSLPFHKISHTSTNTLRQCSGAELNPAHEYRASITFHHVFPLNHNGSHAHTIITCEYEASDKARGMPLVRG